MNMQADSPVPDFEVLCATLAQHMGEHMTPDTALIGIQTGGLWAAQALHERLGVRTPLGEMNVSFYRDDYHSRGLAAGRKPSAIPFSVTGTPIVLVDDVLYTGRTVRAAMNELFDYGRPASVKLAVLVDRGGRELPIAPDWVGQKMVMSTGQSLDLRRDTKNIPRFHWVLR
jgi:pyrimidine operon attenuation protein/uracil phosphoribosyltransferase